MCAAASTQCCALGYWIGERFARQGYMFDAVRALVPFIFGTLGLHRIEAACLPTNEPSKNLLIKAGFRQEGLARRYLQINGDVAGPCPSSLCSRKTRTLG